MIERIFNRDYELWKEITIVADSLRKVGLHQFASILHTIEHNPIIIKCFINMIVYFATKNQNEDVLDRLYFYGLIVKE